LNRLRLYFLSINDEIKPFFKKYEGYISTQLGPQKSKEDLNKIAEKIRK